MQDSLNGFINFDIEVLQKKLSYNFCNAKFLNKVLTHSSSYRKIGCASDFERVELLGDKVLALCLTDILYDIYKKDDEGNLSIRLAFLSGKWFMSKLFINLGLHDCIKISKDCQTISVYTDYMEAIIGAIFLESGYTVVKEFVLRIWGDAITNSLQRDAKSLLQEFMQSKGYGLPLYTVENVSGSENSMIFHICAHGGALNKSGFGSGSSKKEAEQAAAKDLLEKLNNE